MQEPNPIVADNVDINNQPICRFHFSDDLKASIATFFKENKDKEHICLTKLGEKTGQKLYSADGYQWHSTPEKAFLSYYSFKDYYLNHFGRKK
jgi:hypothetical protein